MLDILENPTIKKMLIKQLKKHFAEHSLDCIVIKMNGEDLSYDIYSEPQKIMPQKDFIKLIQSMEL